MDRYTASQMHTKSKAIFREAVKAPVVIDHNNHGEFVLMSIDKFNKKDCSDWLPIEHFWPPFEINSSSGKLEAHTMDVEVMTRDHGIVMSYHDGDVWCYVDLSGCPQYDVTHWRFKNGVYRFKDPVINKE